jgi:hypothetical protein
MRSVLFWDITQRRIVVFADVSGQNTDSFFKGKAAQEEGLFDT